MPDFDPLNLTYLDEDNVWPEQVFKLEDGYFPTGGDINNVTGSGTMNRQAKALADRTRWSKTEIDAIKFTLANGLNFATQADIDASYAALLGGASAAYDTLKEIEEALLDDDSAIAALLARIAALEAQIAGAGVPIGVEHPWTADVAPTGYLEVDHAIYLRADYPELWAHIENSGMVDPTGTDTGMFNPGDGVTTFQLPDSRGEGYRGWDHGRGVDPGRALGSWQDFAIEEMEGLIGGVRRNNAVVQGVFTQTYGGAGNNEGGSGRVDTIHFKASNVVKTAAETRMRTISRMFIIRAY